MGTRKHGDSLKRECRRDEKILICHKMWIQRKVSNTRTSHVLKAGKGEAYYKRMLANKAERSGKFLEANFPIDTDKKRRHAPGSDISLIDSYLKSAVESYWTGRPERPWLSDTAGLGIWDCDDPLHAANATGKITSSSTSLRDQSLLLDGDLVSHDTDAPVKEKRPKVKKGIIIPAPSEIGGAQNLPLPNLSSMGNACNMVHVFWDLEDKHPGVQDPRVVSHRLRQVAAVYGEVEGVYAYATRKVSNWVPDAIIEAAAEAWQVVEAARLQRQVAGSQHAAAGDNQISSQNQDKHHARNSTDEMARRRNSALTTPISQLRGSAQMPVSITGSNLAAAAAGAASPLHSHKYLCPVCGALRRSQEALDAHMQGVHHGAKTSSHLSNRGNHAKQHGSHNQSTTSAVSSAPVISDSGSNSWLPPRNGPNRAIGRVLKYHNSYGSEFVPPPGHQLSLRYILRCEGADVRVAQNAEEDSCIAVASGLLKLGSQLVTKGDAYMDATSSTSAGRLSTAESVSQSNSELRRHGSSRSNQAQKGVGKQMESSAVHTTRSIPLGSLSQGQSAHARPLVVVVSDDTRLAGPLQELKALGFSILVVSSDESAASVSQAPHPSRRIAAHMQRGSMDQNQGSRRKSSRFQSGLFEVADLVLSWNAVRSGDYRVGRFLKETSVND